MKSFYIIFSLMYSLAFNVIAQQRINELPAKCIASGKKLTSAKGYEKSSSTGQWIENQNAINYKKVNVGSKEWSLSEQNFIYLQMCQIDSNYYIMIKQSIHFGKDCPGKDKFVCCETTTYLFTKEQYFLFLKICKNEQSSLTLNLASFTMSQSSTGNFTEHQISENERMLKVQVAIKNIEEKNEMNEESTFILKTVLVGDQRMTRFNFEDQFFEEQYFETKSSNFNLLLIEN